MFTSTNRSAPALRAVLPAHIRRRWDAIAFAQLCEAASRQAEELEALRGDLHAADDSAEFWREQALDMQLQLCERTGGGPGITRSGALVVVDHPHVADAYDAAQECAL